MLLPFDHSFVSELQQEGISRYDCDSQKCPRPGPKPPSRIHYSNQYHAISSQYYTQPLGDYESWRLEVCCLLFFGDFGNMGFPEPRDKSYAWEIHSVFF